MSTAARIEELRIKFEENPRRYFAPLANELRKAGDLTQAIALCREHLPKQPGHMSGYIVFGQALFESGELDEGRVVFEQALALDPENLIALHHLGHIARQKGETQLARRWYERALETDPRNDDIAHQLASLATPVRPVASVPTPPVAAPAVNVPAPDTSAVDMSQELAFLELGAMPLRRDLGAIPTPPLSSSAIDAMPMAPTPDAAMRAVDFDVVNDSLRRPGLAVPAMAEPAIAEPASAEPMPITASNDVRATEPIDLSLDDVADAPAPSVFEAAAAPEPTWAAPTGDTPSDDPFAFANDAPVAGSAADAEDQAGPVDLEADFEEGLVTANWPDTSEFTGRAGTPRSATPLSVEVTPEAVEAFGREPQDPVLAPLPERELDVLGDEADLVSGSFAAVDAMDEVDDVVSSADAGEQLPWLTASATPTEDVSAIVHALEEDARALGETDEVSVFSTPAPSAEFEAPSDAVEAEASFVDVLQTDSIEAPTTELETDIAPEPDADYEDDAEAENSTPAFVTETMGELLVAQGFVDRAVAVYEELVRRRPYDPVLSARLAELREQLETAEPTTVFTAHERYAALAARRVPRRTPPRAATPIVNSAQSLTPAASTSLSTPISTPFRSATPLRSETPVRSATPLRSHTPLNVPAADSLSTLFGTEATTHDDAAQALAEAFAPMPLDDRQGSDVAAESFFGSRDERSATPAYGATRHPTPVAEQGSDFSFDRFFPDPAVNTRGTPAAGEQPVAEPSARTSDDLAQFSAWLKGLGNS